MTSVVPEPDPVVVASFEGPQKQRRWTVALRFILGIPHFFYATILGIVVFFAVVAGWFAALFTGRLPTGIAEFVARVVQYYARVQAYGLYLLADRYPPFDLRASDQALDVHVPVGVRLNRAAVLFRLILLVPVAIVVQLVTSGAWVIVFFAWLIVLIAGRMPTVLFETFAAILRYAVRYFAFAAMLTSEYPRGLFGDKPRHLAEPAAFATPGPPEDEPWAGPDPDDEWPEPGERWEPPASEPAPPPPPPPPPPPTGAAPAAEMGEADILPARPRLTTLILSRGAKALVIVTIVFGVVFQAVPVMLGSTSSESAEQLEAAYVRLSGEAQTFGVEAQRCAVSAEGPACIHTAVRDLEQDFVEFRAELREIEFPGLAIDRAEQVESDATEIIRILGLMAATSDPLEYQQFATEFQELGAQFDLHVEELYDTLVFQ